MKMEMQQVSADSIIYQISEYCQHFDNHGLYWLGHMCAFYWDGIHCHYFNREFANLC